MDDIQRLAQERGGRCLSDSYKNSYTHLLWECMEGHQWKAGWRGIQEGKWCPTCSTGLGERICREYFSQLLGDTFPKARPEWLVNKAGNQMELDGYCASLGIAFEYQGEQHYSTKTHFIRAESALLQRQEDDALKTELCAQRGVTLFHIPEIRIRLPLEQVGAFIEEELKAKGVDLAQDIDPKEIDISRAYRTSGSREALNHLRRIAAGHGGKCLSEHYVSSRTRLLFQCAKGHKWKTTPDLIQKGSWCPICSGKLRKTIEDMQAMAAARGGKCLSPAYEGINTKLLWECDKGHRWEATPVNMKRGKWCRICGRSKGPLSRKLTLAEMQSIAASRGGRCLSVEYINSNTHLLWQCREGHQWKATPSCIKSGRWCPVCAGQAKTMEDMRNLAAQHGGKCLSEVYKNAGTKLLWQCKEGHQWRTTPNSVVKGDWCPSCGHRRAWQKRRAR